MKGMATKPVSTSITPAKRRYSQLSHRRGGGRRGRFQYALPRSAQSAESTAIAMRIGLGDHPAEYPTATAVVLLKPIPNAEPKISDSGQRYARRPKSESPTNKPGSEKIDNPAAVRSTPLREERMLARKHAASTDKNMV